MKKRLDALKYIIDAPNQGAMPIHLVTEDRYKEWLKAQPDSFRNWLKTTNFIPQNGNFRFLPTAEGKLRAVVFICDREDDPWLFARVAASVPAGPYYLVGKVKKQLANLAVLGWGLGSYAFEHYKKREAEPGSLVWPQNAEAPYLSEMLPSLFWARDLINTPANEMGPSKLEAEARRLARQYKAQIKVTTGDALLKANYPTIYTVGQAAADAPRLLDLTWGNKSHPKLTLVGKGVCYDTGGLSMKSTSNMFLMKKDMGGAAVMMGLARMIMAMKLPIRLRLLVPAVENSVDGYSYRPGDVIATRKGITVEITNTDAEGRLVMADALTEACREKPDLLIDCSTLTGAARTALGTEIPAIFSNREEIAQNFMRTGSEQQDPVWALPLWQGYRPMLDSPIAHMINSAEGPYAGAITAALFLEEFVTKTTPWIHIDTMCWNTRSRPGRPVGAEAMPMRALYHFIHSHFKL